MKSKIVEMKQKQLNNVQTSLQCFQVAQNRDALRGCHEQDKKNHKDALAKMGKMKEGAPYSGECR